MKNETSAQNAALAAAGESAQEKTGVKGALDAAEPTTGDKNAPAAGEQSAASRGERFRELINGEFKAEYGESVQNILKQRLKSSEEAVKKYKALAPALKELEKRYGVEAGDAKALVRALERDMSGERNGAGESVRKERASRLYESWLRQASDLRGTYPDFDLTRELNKPRFRALLKNGADMLSAYELSNKDEIILSLAKDMEEKITRRILSGATRPREESLARQSASSVTGDAAHMSKAARQEIIRRVQRGEKISF